MAKQVEETPDTTTEFNDFLGIFLQVDTSTIPPGGSQNQVNVKADQQGCLPVRDGSMPISFDSTTNYTSFT